MKIVLRTGASLSKKLQTHPCCSSIPVYSVIIWLHSCWNDTFIFTRFKCLEVVGISPTASVDEVFTLARPGNVSPSWHIGKTGHFRFLEFSTYSWKIGKSWVTVLKSKSPELKKSNLQLWVCLHNIYNVKFNPYKLSVLFVGHRKTMQTQIGPWRMQCLIRVSNVCSQKVLLKFE